MTRLLIRAAIVSIVTALILTRLATDQQLVFWELVLLVVLFWQMRELPRGATQREPALFDLRSPEPPRLPRAVVGQELAVLDAVSGHLAPERRLQPSMRRIAAHRLGKVGIDIGTEDARSRLGDETWNWLMAPSPVQPDIDTLDRVVDRIEGI